MKCYYEVLSVLRDADDGEIKTAYKKLALRFHPDKNLDNPHEAKEQFQLVQQAYEVLSDRQERAWYDNHREQILRGCDKDYEDKSLDLFQYFTTSCFKGYSDDKNSFYSVYKKVFETLAKEDMEYIDDKDDFMNIPYFGTSNSDYEEVVAPFYAYWMSYSTYKSYVWLDPYDIREAKERRLLKHIEKENKKVRAKAKKERNEEVRNLVAFVRKRDKRVQLHAKKMVERSKENKLKQEKLSSQRRMERRKEIKESGKSAEWTNFNNVQNELEEIEKSLAEQFGEEISNSEDEETFDDNALDNLYCVACSKLFKTPKAFQNHEISKKHKENVDRLRRELLEEEENVSSGSGQTEEDPLSDSDFVDRKDVEKEDPSSNTDEKLNLEGRNETEDLELSSDSEIMASKVENSNLQNEGGAEMDEITSEHIGFEENEPDFDSPTDDELVPKKNKKKMKKVLRVESVEESVIDQPNCKQDSEAEIKRKEKRKPKRKKKQKEGTPEANKTEDVDSDAGGENGKRNKKKQVGNKVEIVEDVNHCCVSCKSKFDSKNKLFQHLKKTGHGVYLPKEQKNVDGKKKGIK